MTNFHETYREHDVAKASSALPAWLAPLSRGWMALGNLLHRLLSPVVLALLFVAVIWPVGLLMRLAGNDPLRLKRAGAKESYWLAHDPLAKDHFTRQF
jgi:hypothetical protein